MLRLPRRLKAGTPYCPFSSIGRGGPIDRSLSDADDVEGIEAGLGLRGALADGLLIAVGRAAQQPQLTLDHAQTRRWPRSATVDDARLAGEADLQDRRSGQTEKSHKCASGARVALLAGALISTTSGLPPRAAARRSHLRKIRFVLEPGKVPQIRAEGGL